ncbi:hypothetical protein FA15DRAFT_754029 [Coprinopsis marcescibilis]|uniref:3-oxo-5-alpha-steroid 4-dehydrogenase C-terminal domain-containing protein n=1 Tax=Coprinopsis marcescibilis TaxID=230819 RepID=A0A5C3L575_COPMA|nr:hypothetical protein FA15DRAFT_754029 [Coprinopsis marcescibilis]
MISLSISPASKSPLCSTIIFDFPQDATVLEVKERIAAQYPKLGVSRQKLSLKGDKKALNDEDKVNALSGKELQVKDLGPQIGWRTVFLIEYVGPLIVHPVIYYYPKLVYGKDVQHSAVQKYVFAFVMLHFLKRELESVLVHRFSHGTMPVRNLFKNSAAYHLLYGVALALDVYRQKYSVGSPYIVGTYRSNETVLRVAAGVWAYAEFSNFLAHYTLRNLRPPGTRKRGIPRGYPFNLISCPNYFFEIVAWSVIAGLTNSVTGYVIVGQAIFTLSQWAMKRHIGYKKEFGNEYPRNRKAIFPFIY